MLTSIKIGYSYKAYSFYSKSKKSESYLGVNIFQPTKIQQVKDKTTLKYTIIVYKKLVKEKKL